MTDAGATTRTTETMADETLIRRIITEEETTTRGQDRLENGLFNEMDIAMVDIRKATTQVPITRQSTPNPRRRQESHPLVSNTKIM